MEMKTMKITYKTTVPIGDFKAKQYVNTIRVVSYWETENLLYCYTDRYNMTTIPKEDIISVEK